MNCLSAEEQRLWNIKRTTKSPYVLQIRGLKVKIARCHCWYCHVIGGPLKPSSTANATPNLKQLVEALRWANKWTRVCVVLVKWPGGRRFKTPALDFFLSHQPSLLPSLPLSIILRLRLFHPLFLLFAFTHSLSLSLIAALPRCVFNHRLSSAGNSVTKDRRRASQSDTPPYFRVCLRLTHNIHTPHTDRQRLHLSPRMQKSTRTLTHTFFIGELFCITCLQF